MNLIFKKLLAWGIAASVASASCSNQTHSPALPESGTGAEATAETAAMPDTTALALWQAGATVTPQAVEAFGGADRCFAAEPVPDSIWERMQGKSYRKNPYIGRDDLRHIRALHTDCEGRILIGEMICNRMIADRLVSILRKLYDARYPIQRMLLPDVYDADDETQMLHNNSSCFCYRNTRGSTKLSKHARGLAVDINTLYNPYHKGRGSAPRNVRPDSALPYCDRSADFPYKIEPGDLCVRFFTEAGFRWGGHWKTCKDYQHFELSGR